MEKPRACSHANGVFYIGTKGEGFRFAGTFPHEQPRSEAKGLRMACVMQARNPERSEGAANGLRYAGKEPEAKQRGCEWPAYI